MKVCFAVPILTCLRYYGPIIEFLINNTNSEIILCVRRNSGKYNGLKSDKNYEILQKIVSSYFLPAKILPMTNSKISCDILFTVETVDFNRYEYQRHYTFQHGFDYNFHAKNADSKTIYIPYSEKYGLDILSKFKTKIALPPFPIAFSNLKRQIEYARKIITTDKKIAFIFFPYKSYVSLTRSIVTYLKKKDFFVIVKQKRKYQLIPKKVGADMILYDDIWYPSETTAFPLISNLAIGFASSAFMELCEIGIPYIDNATIKHYREDPNFYYKPKLDNFWYFEKKFYKNTMQTINHISKVDFKIKNISEDILKKFYLSLFKLES